MHKDELYASVLNSAPVWENLSVAAMVKRTKMSASLGRSLVKRRKGFLLNQAVVVSEHWVLVNKQNVALEHPLTEVVEYV